MTEGLELVLNECYFVLRRKDEKLHSTCTGIEGNRWSLATTRHTVKHHVKHCRVHETRDGYVPLCSRQPELSNIINLLSVSDTKDKAVKVTRHHAPGQSEATRVCFGHHYGPQFRLRLWMKESELLLN